MKKLDNHSRLQTGPVTKGTNKGIVKETAKSKNFPVEHEFFFLNWIFLKEKSLHTRRMEI